MMNLNKRKELASKVLGVGKNKIWFNPSNLEEIKEAITKQDIRDLYESGAIRVKENKGRRANEPRTTRRGPGKIKMTVRDEKGDYMILTRKFRRYINELRKQKKITQEKYMEIRKKIKSKEFKNKAHLKDHIGGKI